MGECYSCQSRSGKQTYMYYASDMSLNSNQTPYSGVRRFSGPITGKVRKSSPNNNSRIRNSNEQLATDEERAALVTITNGQPNLGSSSKSKSQPSISQVGSRFGFRPASAKSRIPGADSNSNIPDTGVTTSTDSLDSYEPSKVKLDRRIGLAAGGGSGLGSKGRNLPAQRPTCMGLGDAFAPPQMARWRMIDDSDTGTLTSMSLSPSTPSDAMLKLLTGDSQRNLDTNGNNMNSELNTNVGDSASGKQSKAHNERKPYSRIPNFGTSRVPSKLQRPSAASTITTSSTSSSSVPEQKEGNNKMKGPVKNKPRRFVGGWFSGKKSQSQDSKSSQLQKVKSQPEKESKNKTNLSKSNIQSKQASKVVEKHLDTNLNETEGSGEAMAEPEKEPVFQETKKKTSKDIVIETEIISGPVRSQNIPDQETKGKETAQLKLKSGTTKAESQVKAQVPLASQDSLDSTSICSLNSDDLMLDMDFDDPADQSLDRSALHLKLSHKTSTEKRGRLFSTEDDFQEEDESDEVDGCSVSNPAVDKAVHAAVASQIRAAAPYTPSTPSVPSSPDVVSSSPSAAEDLKPISPLATETVAKAPLKPQTLNLHQPVLTGTIARSASSPTRLITSKVTNPAPQSATKGVVPIQRRSVDSPRGLRQRVNSATEAVDELTSLTSQLSLNSPLNESHPVQRRPRLRAAGRPASFHGTASSFGDGDSSLPRPRTLRPPRQPSITDEDVEPVAIDGNSYRHMVQDLTTFKTHLLRLKRIIQEDEFSQASKNGYKLAGSPVESPFGMSAEAARLWQGTASAPSTTPDTSNVSLEDVMMENRELRVQLQFMQKQLEEHERTIKLLQQQMTKYACGLAERDNTNATTQTDKPSLTVSKSMVKSTSEGATESESTATGACVGSGQQKAAGGGGAGSDPAVISSTTKTEKDSRRKLAFANGKVNGRTESPSRLRVGSATAGSKLRQPSRLKYNGRTTNIHS